MDERGFELRCSYYDKVFEVFVVEAKRHYVDDWESAHFPKFVCPRATTVLARAKYN